MLTILLGLLNSTGVGSIIGLLGGMVNRILDLKTKSLEMEFKKLDQSHELSLRDKDKEFMLVEYEQRSKLTDKENVGKQIEVNGKIEAEGYKALAESYKFAMPTEGIVAKISQVIRPLLTVSFFFLTIWIFYVVNELINSIEVKPDPQIVYEVWLNIIEWVLFQAGVSIGWWFAMRPNKSGNK